MAAYLGYALRMKTLFRGWPVMAHETHTRRRSYYWTPTWSPTSEIQSLFFNPPPSMTWDLRILETHFLNPGAFHLVNTLRLSQVPDNTDHWTLFTAYDHIMRLVRGVNEARFDPGSLFRFPYHCEMGHFTTVWNMSHTVDRPIFTKLCEIIHTSKRTHLIHFGIVLDPNQFGYLNAFPNRNPGPLWLSQTSYWNRCTGLCARHFQPQHFQPVYT